MNRVVAERYTGFTAIIVSAGNVKPLTGLTGATLAQLTFEGSGVRYRLDGVSAHSGTGHLASAGDVITLHGADVLRGFNVISTAPTGFIQASIGYI